MDNGRLRRVEGDGACVRLYVCAKIERVREIDRQRERER